jgi:hypothetical protein
LGQHLPLTTFSLHKKYWLCLEYEAGYLTYFGGKDITDALNLILPFALTA